MAKSIFVIQEHWSRAHHFDFRLEKDGVLKSWAIPKGVPERPEIKHLAIPVDDHPLSYASFEGLIPKGQYGAGRVAIWENGTFDEKFWNENRIEVMLYGGRGRIQGTYILIKFKKDYLIFKKNEQE